MGSKLNGFISNIMPSVVMVFEHLLPNNWMQNKILPKISIQLKSEINYGNFLSWIRMWFLISMTKFDVTVYFWSKQNIEVFSSAPCQLNGFMIHSCFGNTLAALKFTSKITPI